MSENTPENDNQPEVERTTETVTESGSVPNHPDPREELRTPEPQVERETVTETVSESPDDDGDADGDDNANEADGDDGSPEDVA